MRHSPLLVPVFEAAKIVGGPSRLAAILKISRAAIYQWKRVPAERVLQIVKATNGKITRHDLRPDLFTKKD